MAIVADNGYGYNIGYYRLPDAFKEGVDQVSDEGVRPCSPSLPSTDSTVWAVGDVAEVLDGGYWKASVIEDDLGEEFYQIRVIGSLDEFIADRSHIRMLQEWKNNMWVSLGKDSENCEDGSKSLKRSLSDMSYTGEDYSEYTQKRRAANKKVKLDAIHDDSNSYSGKENSYVNFEEIQSIHDDAILLARASESTECVSVLSSVASCSVSDPLLDRVLTDASTGYSQDDDSFCSDAESYNPSKDGEGNSVGELKDEFQTHELDLRSYRCFLETLYASGPLNWEQEFLLTNIRMKLCVSNDEHLMELKRLMCSGSALRCH